MGRSRKMKQSASRRRPANRNDVPDSEESSLQMPSSQNAAFQAAVESSAEAAGEETDSGNKGGGDGGSNVQDSVASQEGAEASAGAAGQDEKPKEVKSRAALREQARKAAVRRKNAMRDARNQCRKGTTKKAESTAVKKQKLMTSYYHNLAIAEIVRESSDLRDDSDEATLKTAITDLTDFCDFWNSSENRNAKFLEDASNKIGQFAPYLTLFVCRWSDTELNQHKISKKVSELSRLQHTDGEDLINPPLKREPSTKKNVERKKKSNAEDGTATPQGAVGGEELEKNVEGKDKSDAEPMLSQHVAGEELERQAVRNNFLRKYEEAKRTGGSVSMKLGELEHLPTSDEDFCVEIDAQDLRAMLAALKEKQQPNTPECSTASSEIASELPNAIDNVNNPTDVTGESPSLESDAEDATETPQGAVGGEELEQEKKDPEEVKQEFEQRINAMKLTLSTIMKSKKKGVLMENFLDESTKKAKIGLEQLQRFMLNNPEAMKNSKALKFFGPKIKPVEIQFEKITATKWKDVMEESRNLKKQEEKDPAEVKQEFEQRINAMEFTMKIIMKSKKIGVPMENFLDKSTKKAKNDLEDVKEFMRNDPGAMNNSKVGHKIVLAEKQFEMIIDTKWKDVMEKFREKRDAFEHLKKMVEWLGAVKEYDGKILEHFDKEITEMKGLVKEDVVNLNEATVANKTHNANMFIGLVVANYNSDQELYKKFGETQPSKGQFIMAQKK